MQKENKLTKGFIIGTFITLYVMVSLISTIHVIDFFELSNPRWLAITLALSFEVGAAASLASIIALKKMNKSIVWLLFFILTAMQAMGNAFFAYTHLTDYQPWIELFGLVDREVIEQKRILSIVSGAILPLVALGFIKSLVDYIRPEEENGIDVIIDDGGISEHIKKAKEDNSQELKNESEPVSEPIEEVAEEATTVETDEGDITNIEDDFEENSLIDIQMNPTPQETATAIDKGFFHHEEKPVENDPENYPVYDKPNEIKNNGIENIMVFTKDGSQ